MAKPENETKTFTFRCEWRDESSQPDGYSYAIRKGDLLAEIKRRQLCSKGKALPIKVVPVMLPLWKTIKDSKVPVFSTVRDKHPLDVERSVH